MKNWQTKQPKSETINLDDLTIDPAFQTRAQIDPIVLAEYTMLARQDPSILPPIEVSKIQDAGLYPADGYTRVEAYRAAGCTTIQCIVHQRTRQEALVAALGANQLHGQRRTNADKRRTVILALQDPEIRTMSERDIAKLCGVAHTSVQRIKQELAEPQAVGQPRVGWVEYELPMFGPQGLRLLSLDDLPGHASVQLNGALLEFCCSRGTDGSLQMQIKTTRTGRDVGTSATRGTDET